MKKNITKLIVMTFAVLVVSCASTPKYVYEESAVTIHLKSGPDLNLYEDLAHTLLLCVYQLKDPNAFKQLTDESEGIPRLLGCTRFDPSVTGSKRIVMQPDEEITKILDRAEGTKYIGIVAGYYRAKKDSMVRLIEVPLSMLSKSPKKMKINLYLGAQEIQELGGK